MKIDLRRLRYSWHNLLQVSQANSQLEAIIFRDLVTAYSHHARHYHNLNHIQQLLTLSEIFKDHQDSWISLQFTTWFHDYIYHPQAQNNELQSALYAEKKLNELNIAPDRIQLVTQIILSTQNHQPLTTNSNNVIFLDLDLAILGASPDRYLQYSQAIRQEYIWLSDQDYQQGRKQVLQHFLARARIYFTDYFYQSLEAQARTNLASEISKLTGADQDLI